jgi:hypothetical protein
MRRIIVLGSMLLTACLDPLVSDTPSYSEHIRRPGATIPALDPSGELAGTIRGADGVNQNPVPRRTAFVSGAAVHYWDFGPAVRFATTEYRLFMCEADADGGVVPGVEVVHAPIIDSVPGDAAYSPVVRVWAVCVTPLYAGEVLPSRRALEDAVALGLVQEPLPTTAIMHMPVLGTDVVLDVGADTPASPSALVYFEGVAITRFFLGGEAGGRLTLPGSSTVLRTGRVYRLKKTGDTAYAETVFSTPRRMGDGPHPSYTPIWRVVDVTMSAAFVPGSVTTESALFTVMGTNLTPVHPDLTSFVLTETYVNHELQFEEGTP